MNNKVSFIKENIKYIQEVLEPSEKKSGALFEVPLNIITLTRVENLKASIKIDKDSLFIEYDKKPKGKDKLKRFELDNLKESDKEIYNELSKVIVKIFDSFKYELGADIHVDNYKDYLKNMEDVIINQRENKVIPNIAFSTTKLSNTMNIKKSGKEFGLGDYSSLSMSLSITMALPIENLNNFIDFSQTVIYRKLNDMFDKLEKRGQNVKKN